MNINWYPGHMARAKRLLAEQLKRVDVVIELCDARLPRSSRNPDLMRMCRDKKLVVLLSKADLASPRETEIWLNEYRHQGITCAAVDMNKDARRALGLIDKAAKDTVERAAQRGIRKTVRAMVVGVPNVGKSTFINRLHGGAIAKVGDMPGVTRANQWVKISPYLELLDTPGLLWPRLDDQRAARRLAYISAIRDQVVDGNELALQLLYDLLKAAPEEVIKRFKIKDPSLRGEALLEEVCRGRGFLMKGGVCDIDRACITVLDEFRGGKLGRITLEVFRQSVPEEKKRFAADKEEQDADKPAGEAQGTD